ncbi:hypothetical protein TOPH_08884 [Tolypocladium ophioglossoides CBS 100239]|uniref:Nephrocystin 3-like N-terminal domain-containing protein n=1 Tax=Tolypocladium ophioglossoides (strain CBS 100239) TaxID=1163406 RepID=A0A0L0MX36_TOLOC|nr:hypothetical protein TOPH_08884 [Tolypocladium ophioglossoides CBS 100239]
MVARIVQRVMDATQVEKRLSRETDEPRLLGLDFELEKLVISHLVAETIAATKETVSRLESGLLSSEDGEILDWLTPTNYGTQRSDLLGRRQPGAGQWLLESSRFREAGKTILTSVVIDYLTKHFETDPSVRVAYVYCNFRRQDEQAVDHLLASLLKHLVEG